MKVPIEPMSRVVADVAEVVPAGRITPGVLERAWRINPHRGYSPGLMSLARERMERMERHGLVEPSPGPRGGRGWAWTPLAAARYPEAFSQRRSA